MSSTITALRFHGNKDIRIDQVSRQELTPDSVRITLSFCGICGSDIHEYLGGPIFAPPAGQSNPHTGVTLPTTLGHEFSGVVAELGSDVTTLKVGDHVAVNPSVDDRHLGLELCTMCKEGRFNICRHWCCHGLSAPGGGLSDEIVVKDFACVKLPEGVSLRAGALAEPFAVANHMIELSGIRKGGSALVLGGGPIGLALLLLLKARIEGLVAVSEIGQARKEKAKEFGADRVVSPAEEDVVEVVQGLTGGEGVDVAFEATGLQVTLDTAIKAVRTGGTIFNVAIHEKPLLMNPNDLFFGEKKYLGGMCYTTKDFEVVVGLMADGTLEAEKMVTAVVPLEDAIDGAFKELINNKEKHVKILVQPKK